MQLYPAVLRPGEASPAQAYRGHAKVAAVFLHEYIGGHLTRAKQAVGALVNGKIFGNAVGIGRVGIVPSGIGFAEGNMVGPVAVHLVGAHKHKGGFRGVFPCGLQQVEGAGGVGIKIVEGNSGSAVVAWLCCGVYNGCGPQFAHELQHTRAVADIKGIVGKALQGLLQAAQVGGGIALRAKKHRALIVVEPVHLPSERVKIGGYFAADQSGRTGY